jgi:hypothetical protein
VNRPVCDCGHEKRDHVMPSTVAKNYGSCKVCLCTNYARKGDIPRRPVNEQRADLVQQH